MAYYASRTKLSDGRTLGDLMLSSPPFALRVGETKMQRIAMPPGTMVTPPDGYFFPPGGVAAIEMTIVGRMGRRLSGNVRIEPSTFRGKVVYSNVITGDRFDFSFDQLPLNTAGVIAGRFYFLVHPLRYYYCASISAGIARWEMIESFQNEELVRSTYNQEVKLGAFYIPVSDKKIVERLRRRLDDYRALRAKQLPRRGFRLPPRTGQSKRKPKRR